MTQSHKCVTSQLYFAHFLRNQGGGETTGLLFLRTATTVKVAVNTRNRKWITSLCLCKVRGSWHSFASLSPRTKYSLNEKGLTISLIKWSGFDIYLNILVFSKKTYLVSNSTLYSNSIIERLIFWSRAIFSWVVTKANPQISPEKKDWLIPGLVCTVLTFGRSQKTHKTD
jgi:hypothetical protein